MHDEISQRWHQTLIELGFEDDLRFAPRYKLFVPRKNISINTNGMKVPEHSITADVRCYRIEIYVVTGNHRGGILQDRHKESSRGFVKPDQLIENGTRFIRRWIGSAEKKSPYLKTRG